MQTQADERPSQVARKSDVLMLAIPDGEEGLASRKQKGYQLAHTEISEKNKVSPWAEYDP